MVLGGITPKQPLAMAAQCLLPSPRIKRRITTAPKTPKAEKNYASEVRQNTIKSIR
jgi:hypothetical protein